MIGFSFGTLEQILLFYHWHSASKKYKFSSHKHKFHAKVLKFCHLRKLNDMKCVKTCIQKKNPFKNLILEKQIFAKIDHLKSDYVSLITRRHFTLSYWVTLFFFVLYRFPIKIWDDNFKTLGKAYGSGYTVCYEALHMREWAWKKK